MTPAVRRLLREHNLSLNAITATGRNNRVLKEDVQRFIDGGQSPSKAPSTAATPVKPAQAIKAVKPEAVAAKPAPAFAADPIPVSALREPGALLEPVFSVSAPATIVSSGEDRVEPIRGIKKAMVKSMTAALKVKQLIVTHAILRHVLADPPLWVC